MITSKTSININISPNLKILIVPTFVLIATISLSLVAFSNFYPRITKKIEEYNSYREVERVLEDKVNHLTEIHQGISSQGDKLVVIMPAASPIAWMISQLRVIGFENNATLTQIDVVTPSKEEDLTTTKLSVVLEVSDTKTLLSFLSAISNIAPISTIDIVEMTRKAKGEPLNVDLEISLFWSDFPKSLAPITEPVTRLSQSEIDLINKVAGIRLPSFTFLEPSLPEDRETPFN